MTTTPTVDLRFKPTDTEKHQLWREKFLKRYAPGSKKNDKTLMDLPTVEDYQ